MPNQSKDLQQDFSLPGHHILPETQAKLTTGVQLQSTGLLPGQNLVSSDILNTSLHFRQGEPVPQGYNIIQYNTCHVSSPQRLMPDFQESGSLVDSLLVEAANILLSKTEDHATSKCSTTHGTSTTGRNCMSFQAGDPHQQYATYKTPLTDMTTRPLQAEDLQSHHPSEDPDMETGNDSSSNELNELDENGKARELKSGSIFQPPPCSSNAFSLMMADSEHNPSTSGYSSEQPAKAKTQKELMKILKELRSCLPAEKRFRGKSSTAASLRYALHCMQQVKANEDYYQLLMINNEPPCGQDLSCYTVGEIANITSEYTKNNMDVFAVAVSLATGGIHYISEQASVVLRCNKDLFSHVRFVELLAPQDVSVFYSSTNPYKLPSWSICNGGDSGHLDRLEEKSFYCRISCGHESRLEVSYHPFRFTPYLIRIQMEADGGTAEHLCCILFAERVHSGYEAPRIPADKRVFTTTHTPSCLFQDVDERAVPLLGYLPQDLIGVPILLHLHPDDHQLMLAVHKKILQCGGQPFDFSPIRFCARNGEYITIDTSWSSFINPWSRKVSFIIGRHKVRMGPVNEDIFTAPPHLEDQSLQPGIQELTEQIHQLLMQPVQNSGSSGYGSFGSHGSHKNPMSGASSSDSNGNLNEDVKEKHGTPPVCGQKRRQRSTSLEIKNHKYLKAIPKADVTDKVERCSKNVNSEGSGMAAGLLQCDPLPVKQPPYSYQQINCLDSVIRYLESCSVLSSDRKKFVPPSSMASFVPDKEKDQMQEQRDSAAGLVINSKTGVTSSSRCLQSSLSRPATACQTVPGSLPHPSLTSVPVSGAAIKQLSMVAKAESLASLTSHCSYSSTIVHVGDKKLQPETELEDGPAHSEVLPPAPANTEREPYKQLGLTKEVLVAHTHREENDFLSGFMDSKKLSAFQTRCNSYMHERPGALRSHVPPGNDNAVRRSGKARKAKVKRVRPESWDSSSSGVPQAHRPPLPGLNTTAWSQSDTSLASFHPLPYPVLPAYPMSVFPPPQIPVPNESIHGAPSTTLPIQPFPTPLLSPMVALVLPNYMYPPGMAPTVYPGAAPQHLFPVQPSLYTPQPTMTASDATFPVPQPTYPVPEPVCPPAPHVFPVSPPECPPAPHVFPVPPLSSAPPSVESPCSVQPFPYPIPPNGPKVREGFSRSSTPQEPQTPPLFQSRCSSPLQLNLLQLEESQKTDRSEGATGGPGNHTIMPQTLEDLKLQARSTADAENSEALSTGSDFMDILLQEDAFSATCSASAVSESLTSGSHRNGSSQTSRSSKYFGSVDSSENNQKGRGSTPSTGESVMKYVLQDPMWLLMANADENVMMTYQIPVRDVDSILREDRDKLKSMQKLQPRFTEDQRKELGEIHPWMQRGGLPRAVEVTGCVFCKEKGADCSEYTETIQELELSGIMESCD